MTPTTTMAAIGSAAIASASICLYIDADNKNKQAQHILSNLSRLQLITALAEKDKIIRSEEYKMAKTLKKVSTKAKVAGAAGVVLIGAGIAVDQLTEKQPTEKTGVAGWFEAKNKVAFSLEAAGAAAVCYASVQTILDLRAAKKREEEADALPEVADPAPAAQG
jgi:hypothetical protein